MSYQSARRQLVDILEEITVTDTRIPGRFKHVPEGRSGENIKSRSFWIEANVDGDGGITGPYTPDLGGQPRSTFPVTITVTYRDMTDRATLDEVLAADFRDMAVALLNPGNWERSTSLIHSITTNPVYLPTRRSYGDGSVEQRSFLSLLFS